jgi:hypothetical protein
MRKLMEPFMACTTEAFRQVVGALTTMLPPASAPLLDSPLPGSPSLASLRLRPAR